MSKMSNGNGTYSCWACGTITGVAWGDCPQCALVKIQREAAADAQDRITQENKQRDQIAWENENKYTQTEGYNSYERMLQAERNGFMMDDDFANTTAGRAALEAYKPIREKNLAYKRYQETCNREIEKTKFIVKLDRALGVIFKVSSAVFVCWCLFKVLV